MVRYFGDIDHYKRGCNDGATFVLSIVLLAVIVALYVSNYGQQWPIFIPVLHLALSVANMILFSVDSVSRYRSGVVLISFLALHLSVIVVDCVILGLMVTQPSIFLSTDCLDCTYLWESRTDPVCIRAFAACSQVIAIFFVLFGIGLNHLLFLSPSKRGSSC